jgi:hypothetical protein
MKQYLLLMLSVGFAETAMPMEKPPEDGIEKELSALLSPDPLQVQDMVRFRIRAIATLLPPQVGQSPCYLLGAPRQVGPNDPYAPKEEIVSLIFIEDGVDALMGPMRLENNNAAAEEQECSICMELITHAEIASGGTKQVACCKQEFHTECLEKWLKQQQSCPLCRAEAANY